MKKILSPLRSILVSAALAGSLLAQQLTPGGGGGGASDASTPSVATKPPVNLNANAAGGGIGGAPVAGDPFVKGNSGVSSGVNTVTLTATLADAPTPENFQLLFELYDVSRADFAALLLDAGGDDTLFHSRVDEWVGAKRAKLAEFFVCAGRPGVRAVIESIHEVRYPTEFDPPIAEEDHAFPTAFETRNAGETVEFEYTPDEKGQLHSLAVALTEARLARFEDLLGTPGRETSVISQPIFATRKFSTNLTLPMNSLRFAGTMSASRDDTTPSDTVRLVFVRSRRAHHTEKPKAVPGADTLRLEYTFYSLERTSARDVLLANEDPQKLHDALRKLTQAGQARLEHVSTNVTSNGNRTVTEEISEIRYGTEFSTPSFPKSGVVSDDNSNPSSEPQDPPQPGEPNAAKAVTPPTSKVVHTANQSVTIVNPLPPGAFPKKATIPGMFAAFETRNAGFTAEAEPTVSPDATYADINTVPQFVRYMGDLQTTGIAKSYPAQPLFETRKCTVSVTAGFSQQELLSTFNTPVNSGANGTQDDGRVTLGFLRVVPLK